MAISSNSAALFVLDCSPSMSLARTHTRSDGVVETMSPLEQAKTYINSKIVQRMLRELKTTPAGVLLYAHPKTKNQLTQQLKDREGSSYDKHEDGYRNMYELITLDPGTQCGMHMVDAVRAVEGGRAGEASADAHSALILALETFCAAPSKILGASWTRVVYLLTDSESESDWDSWERTADRFREKEIGCVVIGAGFDDEETGQFEQDKSTTKRHNESSLRSFISRISSSEASSSAAAVTTSCLLPLASALHSLSTPSLKSVTSQKNALPLTLGSPSLFPDSSLVMRVEVKKATSAVGNRSMKKYSMRGYEKAQGREREEMRRKSEREAARYGGGNGAYGAGVATKDEAEGETHTQTQRNIFESPSQPAGGAATSASNQASTSTAANSNSKFQLGDIGRPLPRLLLEEGLLPSSDPHAVAFPASNSDAGEDDEVDLTSHEITLEKTYLYRPSSAQLLARQQAREAVREKKLQAHLARGGTVEDFPSGEEGAEDEEGEDENEDTWEAAPAEELTSAYAYGGQWVPAEDMDANDAGVLGGLRAGLEVVGFMKMDDVRMDYRMGDVYYVLPTIGQTGSNLTFSALINAMLERNSCAIVRFVGKSHIDRKGGGKEVFPDPKMGIMWPVVEEYTDVEFCYWCRMPFSEDVRKLTFPSLTEVRTANGVVTEHPNIPTAEQQSAMDDFVDFMDLSKAGPEDEDGNPTGWFSTSDSYNPAIHNIQNALVHRLSNPYGPLPPVPNELTKYLEPPKHVVDGANEAAERLKEVMNVKFVPPKPKKVKKNINNFTAVNAEQGQYDNMLDQLLGGDPAPVDPNAALPKSKAFAPRQEEVKMELDDEEKQAEEVEEDYVMVDSEEVKPKPSPKVSLDAIELSDDEDEPEPDTEDEEDLLKEPSTSKGKEKAPDASGDVDMKPTLPTSAPPHPKIAIREHSIIEDFRKALDDYGPDQALHPLFSAVHQAVKTSFSTQKYKLATGALKKAREEARALGAARTYNAGIQVLINSIRADKHTQPFLSWIKTEGVGPIIGKALGGVDAETARKMLDD